MNTILPNNELATTAVTSLGEKRLGWLKGGPEECLGFFFKHLLNFVPWACIIF